MSKTDRKSTRQKVHRRIRKKISGTAARPRLAVHFSNKHVYAQLIDDHEGTTLASVSTTEKAVESGASANIEVASTVGRMIAERAGSKNVSEVVFDRGGFIYHGKVKALADAAREGGLKF